MRCRDFREHLLSWVEGEAVPGGAEAMRAHRDACGDCRALHTAMAETDIVDASDLTADILARTSGSGCDRARDLLSGGARLGGTDSGLVASHLDRCALCAAVARVVAVLPEELPKLAWEEPDRAFLTDVLAATTRPDAGAGVARRAPVSLWQRIARRPRLALEGAYVGTLVVMLTVGLPGRSVAEVSGRLYDGLRQQGVHVEQAIGPQLAELAAAGREVLARGAAISLAQVREQATRTVVYERVAGTLRFVRERAAGVIDFLNRQANRLFEWIAAAWRAYVTAALEPEQESSNE